MIKHVQLILLLGFGFMITQCSTKYEILKNEMIVEEKVISNQDSFELSFNILPNEITYKFDRWRKLEIGIFAELKLTNLMEKEVEIDKTIFYGLKTEGDSHIEVLDFNLDTIDVEREMHYQYLFFD
ncbi:MAG: hypothetical protein AB8F94_10840 [Saprospiraceae bacterium]